MDELNNKNIRLRPAVKYLAEWESNTIAYPSKINCTKITPDRTVSKHIISVLHEYGHIRQSKSKLKQSSISNILDSELSAWKFALQWLKKHNAPESIHNILNTEMTNCLLSYCKWIAKTNLSDIDVYATEYK